MASEVQIKGIREGLLVTLGDGSWDEVRQSLLTHLDQQAIFLRGARLALDVGSRNLKTEEIEQINQEIANRNLEMWAVLSESLTTESSARTLGLTTQLSNLPKEKLFQPEIGVDLFDEPAILIQRTLRSGYAVQSPGHVIVIGDVNPGAEIIAAGNIIVWGKLKGVVHAGASGDEHAIICALDLSPTQLRIASSIATTPKRRGKPQPEIASLRDGRVIAEIWEPKGRSYDI